MANWSAIIILTAVVGTHTAVLGENALAAKDDRSYCAYVDKKVVGPQDGKLQIGENSPGESEERDLIFNNTVERCSDNLHQCYSFWYIDPDNKDSITILKQGCWNTERQDCDRSECISDRALEAKSISNITRWCCCYGNLCNANVTDLYVPGLVMDDGDSSLPESVSQSPLYDPNYRMRAIITPLLLVTGVSVLVLCVYLCVRRHLQGRAGELGGVPMSEPGLTSHQSASQMYPALDGLKLNTVIHSGRYGEVWKGALNEITVAVKVLRAGNRNLFVNERDILSLPLLDPKHVPVFYGAEEKVSLDGMPEYLLVSQFMELGMLQTYLKNNVLRWNQMCRFLQSIASGLTHLHTEIQRGDKMKLAIAHRDLNSRNILVTSDLTCVICDYGFAMKLDRQRSEEMGEQPTLSDVGTIRYMAPEVLDGAVNLRECESSLKQIDIYALGLVFWEVGMRCADLYQGLPVPEYQLPFQADVGIHPAFEEMQDFVSREKRRPLFPDVWKSTNSAIRALKETIEDCWDQDGEARLTSNCVEERVVEMSALWEARQKGVTPTVNATATLGNVGLEGRKTEPCNLPPPPTSSSSVSYHYPSNRGASLSSSEGSNYHRYSALENSISEATTETMLLSPSDSDVITPPPVIVNKPPPNQTAHNLMYYPKQSRQLAPHQGLNPTVARNTHKSSDEDMRVRGNTLVVGGQRSGDSNSNSGGGGGGSSGDVGSPLLTEALIDAIEENLVRNDILHTNDHRPISFHDNQVASEPLMITPCPKQQNLPQAGSSPKVKSLFSRLRHKNKPEKVASASTSSSSSSRFSLPFFSRSLADKSQAGAGSGSSEENMDNLVEIRPGSGHYRTRSSEGELIRQQKSNLNRRPPPPPPSQHGLSTEVRMVHGMPVVQPSTSTSPQPSSSSPGSDTSPPGDSARRPNSLFLNGGHNYPRPLPPVNQPPMGGAYNVNEARGGGAYDEPPSGAPAPVGQPIYNEMPSNPNVYNPVNLSVNVVPGGARNEAINEVGGAFSFGSDSGPPPNVDLPPNWNSKCNLQRANTNLMTVAPPTLAPPTQMASTSQEPNHVSVEMGSDDSDFEEEPAC